MIPITSSSMNYYEGFVTMVVESAWVSKSPSDFDPIAPEGALKPSVRDVSVIRFDADGGRWVGQVAAGQQAKAASNDGKTYSTNNTIQV